MAWVGRWYFCWVSWRACWLSFGWCLVVSRVIIALDKDLLLEGFTSSPQSGVTISDIGGRSKATTGKECPRASAKTRPKPSSSQSPGKTKILSLEKNLDLSVIKPGNSTESVISSLLARNLRCGKSGPSPAIISLASGNCLITSGQDSRRRW